MKLTLTSVSVVNVTTAMTKNMLGALYVIAVTKEDVVRKWIVYVGDSAH